MKLFFFGTLMDPDIRAIVLGRDFDPDRIQPAIVQGFRRVFVAGRHYPMLLRHALGWVEGTLVTGVDAQALHRLQVYEGWEYALRPIQVQTKAGHKVMAHVFMCPPGIEAKPRPWTLEEWQRRHKRTFLSKAQQHMQRVLRRPALAMRPPPK